MIGSVQVFLHRFRGWIGGVVITENHGIGASVSAYEGIGVVPISNEGVVSGVSAYGGIGVVRLPEGIGNDFLLGVLTADNGFPVQINKT